MADWVTPAFGLGGVVVGSITTLVPSWWAHQREQRDSVESKRKAQAEAVEKSRRAELAIATRARTVGRLLIDDLDQARKRLKWSHRKGVGQYWSARFALPLATWVENRAMLAGQLGADDWELVAAAFRDLQEIEASAAAARRGDSESQPPITANDAQRMRRVVAEIVGPAIEALTRFAEVPKPRDDDPALDEPPSELREEDSSDDETAG